MNIIFVGIGGALGSIFRYLLSQIPIKVNFPVNTLIINILGSFIIGIVVASTVKFDISKEINLLLKVGFCGGFTTFSTFSLESYELLKDGQIGIMFLYMFLSLSCCLIGIWLGMKIVE